jgi:HPt (histidine-containing phosphotransfer) domain-containing protein
MNDEVLDLNPWLELANSDPAFRNTFLAQLQAIVERCPRQIEEARLAWQDGRGDDAAHLLHGLRGSIGMLGATQFCELSRGIEQAMPTAESEQVALLFSAIGLQASDIAAEMKRTLKQQAFPSGSPVGAPGIDPE